MAASSSASGESTRGQTETAGFVIIIGMVVLGSMLVVGLGAVVIGDTEDQLSEERVERAFVQFDSKASLVALGQSESHDVAFGSAPIGSDDLSVQSDRGWMRVTITDSATADTTEVMNLTLGALVYEGDGFEIAYQGGGVWRANERDGQVVSPPGLTYRNGTLTLPAAAVSGDSVLDEEATITGGSTETRFPNSSEGHENPVTNGIVNLTVSSEFYRGWGEFLEDRTDGRVKVDDENRTTKATLFRPGDLLDSAVFTQSGELRGLDSNNSQVVDYGGQTAKALGPKIVDFDDDDRKDVPYLPNASSLALLDGNDDSPRVTDIGGAKADTQKTALAVGSWDGSPTSVFYAGEEASTIYRVVPGGSPVSVDSPADGVDAVLGPGDVDGDGTDELVFADASQEVRYLQPDGTVETTGQTAGSANNIGAARPVDIDGDGTARVPVVNDTNRIILVDSGGVEEALIEKDEDEESTKSHLAVTDIDTDGKYEVVYLENNNSPADLRYVDDVGAGNTFESIYDDDGNRVPGDKKRGVAGGVLSETSGTGQTAFLHITENHISIDS